MKYIAGITFLILSSIVFNVLGLEETEFQQTKNRRGASSSSKLLAFPRIGRRDPSMPNNLFNSEAENTAAIAVDLFYPDLSEEYGEYPKAEVKRASLRAFPRIGRTDAEIRKWTRLLALQQAFDKRAGPSATTGVWFGPRLGKRSASNDSYE
uniref:Cardio acceleratory peptide 2b n=1 Tax=Glossina brevipalpis TaxID=37001 RepID=A0A1A9WYZ5_9MUSC